MDDCCLRGFQWDAKPKGTSEINLAGRKCYVTGSNPDRAIMIIHDLFGWTFPNTQILADHFAEEVNATVYIPDFFGDEVLPVDVILDVTQWAKLDLPAFLDRNSKSTRTPQIIECAKILKSRHQRLGAIGFCFGGWGVFRLAAKSHDNLVDCISTAHPTNLDKEEIQSVGVPVQIMAPEFDSQFTEELKTFSNQTIPKLGVAYDYQYFPGLEHAFAIRGDPRKPAEREGMERAKNAAVLWFRQWLRVE